MREIKFRGLRIDGGGWVYGYYVQAAYKDGIGNIITRHYIAEDPAIVNCHNNNALFTTGDYLNSLFQVDPATVGQYTGLKDKNGKEMYYSDWIKVRYEDQTGIDREVTGLLCEGDFGPMLEFESSTAHLSLFSADPEDFEVAGNLYENPDLLENKQ